MRSILLWFGALIYGLPTVGRQRFQVWEGATVGWSPTAETEATGGAAGWDVQGWLDDGQAEIHAVLDAIERDVWLRLVEVREQAYEWRDSECLLSK